MLHTVVMMDNMVKKKNLDEKQFSTVVSTRLVCEYKVHKTCDCYLCQLQELFLSMMEVK